MFRTPVRSPQCERLEREAGLRDPGEGKRAGRKPRGKGFPRIQRCWDALTSTPGTQGRGRTGGNGVQR